MALVKANGTCRSQAPEKCPAPSALVHGLVLVYLWLVWHGTDIKPQTNNEEILPAQCRQLQLRWSLSFNLQACISPGHPHFHPLK